MAEPLILVVDDQAENLKKLDRILKHAGYAVALAIDGERALNFLNRRQPDLILCDIIMPKMDGYTLSAQLKDEGLLNDIPLIFLTARTEQEDIIRGFECGAVDYVTKPFHPEELLARVNTHLELKKARDTVLAYNHQLEELNQEKNQFLSIAAHDLRNPLTSIMLSSEMVETRFERLGEARVLKYVSGIYGDAQRMLTIISNLLDVYRIENGHIRAEKRWFNLSALLHQTVASFLPYAEKKHIQLNSHIPSMVEYYSDPELLFQILENLMSNAIKYTEPHKQVTLTLNLEPLSIHIEDEGPGFSKADRERLFEKFARLSARPTSGEASTGLGLSIVKQLCDLTEIQVRCVSEPEVSAHFVLDLPKEVERAV